MSKILEHLKRIKLHRLGHWSVASVRNGNDTQTNKLLRQLSKAEKKQYRLWCDKAFWMQHAAVQECGSFPFDKTFTWIVRSDAYIRSWRKSQQHKRRHANVIIELVPAPNHHGYMTPFGEFPSERAWLEWDLQRLSTICAAHTPPGTLESMGEYHTGRKAAIKTIEERLAILAKEDPGQESSAEWDARGGTAPYDYESYQRERARRGVDCWPT